ncbi:MAG: hypothetical protein ACKVS9_18300 [Phycisphaerae bacterium]
MLAEADNTTWLVWLALSAICLTALVVIAARRQQFLQWALRSDRRDQRIAERERRETEALATDVIQQFEQVSRRLSDELAEKSRELRELIALADLRVASAAQETGSRKRETGNGEQQAESSLGSDSEPAVSASSTPLPVSRFTSTVSLDSAPVSRTTDAIELHILGNRLTLPTRRPRITSIAEPPAPTVDVEPSPPPADLPPTMLRVWELADQGISPSDIAEQTSLMLGEVELLLNLRKLT